MEIKELLPITRICVDLYQNSELIKAVQVKSAYVLTSDYQFILKHLNFQDSKAVFLVKSLRGILKSAGLHRRYIATLLHFLIANLPFADIESLISTLKRTKSQIEVLLRSFAMPLKNEFEVLSFYPYFKSLHCFQKGYIAKLKRPGNVGVEQKEALYVLCSASKGKAVKYFLSSYICYSQLDKNTYLYKGYLSTEYPQRFPCIYLCTTEPEVTPDNTLVIPQVPKSLLNKLKSDFYFQLRIELFETNSPSSDYQSSVSYGFECIDDLDGPSVLNLLIYLPGFYTFLLRAPTDAHLAFLSMQLQRALRRIELLNTHKLALPGGGTIETMLSSCLEDSFISKSFLDLSAVSSGVQILDDYFSKQHAINQALNLLADLLSTYN